MQVQTNLSDTSGCPFRETWVSVVENNPVTVFLVAQPGPQSVLVCTEKTQKRSSQ